MRNGDAAGTKRFKSLSFGALTDIALQENMLLHPNRRKKSKHLLYLDLPRRRCFMDLFISVYKKGTFSL